MCRCCQNCWEDFKWSCFEEKFCYDESIANYNPDEDEDYVATQKNGNVLGHIQTSDNNNLTVPLPICNQPVRNYSGLISNAKIHEEDYRRETQTNVPMLGPEILAVFANSQIFQDHQPTKLTRISTKTFLAGIHSPNKEVPTTPRESDQDRLLRRLEGNDDKHQIQAQHKRGHNVHYQHEHDDNDDYDNDNEEISNNSCIDEEQQQLQPLKYNRRKSSISSGVAGQAGQVGQTYPSQHKVKFYLD